MPEQTITREPFTDPARNEQCELVIPAGGRVHPINDEPKIGVAHPDCDEIADLALDLDAFFCPACKRNGRISGAWACLRIEAVKAHA